MRHVALFFFLMLGFSLTASANSNVPECWKESNSDVGDGQFLVALDTTKMDIKELVQILGMLNSEVLWSERFPIVMDRDIYVAVSAQQGRFSRARLKRKVSQELRAMLNVSSGVLVECDLLVEPQPGIGVRN